MSVFDCCMFLNENDLYEIRLNEHWNYVDKFIVLEAGETHTGLKKEFKFDQKRFEKYSEKLIYRTFDSFEVEITKNQNLIDSFMLRNRQQYGQNTEDWIRDHFQANYLYKILLEIGAKEEDIILISCLDEILNKNGFEVAFEIFNNKKEEKYQIKLSNGAILVDDNNNIVKTRPLFGFELDTYVYKFNLFNQVLCAAMMTELSTFSLLLPATLRSLGLSTHNCIKNAGWHFTFFDDGDGEKVLEKQRSWAHSKDILPGQKVKFYNTNKEEALDRMFADYKTQKVEISYEKHPHYLVNNIDKYKNYLF